MDPPQVTEIIECLPKGRTKFHYFRDRYALDLLRWFVGRGKTVAEVKRSRYARLLAKPRVRALCARLPDGRVTPEHLLNAWAPRPLVFLLTLGRWGSRGHAWRTWYQVSRPGENLVLQLNFSGMHNRRYERLMRSTIEWWEGHPFLCTYHPVNDDGRLTLAWARLDVDLDGGEALVEEIQNDWIREAFACWRSIDERPLARYRREVLAPYVRVWDEAMLAATLWFLREELGVRRIFYHTFESGNRLKHISGRRPPRSLYTELPRRFCFEETADMPRLLACTRHRRLRKELRRGTLRWFLLEL